MEIKITKKVIIDSSNGGTMSDAYKYYLVYGKIFNDDNTRYRRFRFAMRIWKDDLFAYEDYPDTLSMARQNEITNEMLYSFIDCYYPKSYNECSNFYNACKESIQEYNERICAY